MSSQLRSASGSVAISFWLTTVPSTADCVSSSGVTPSTSTRSLTPPTGSVDVELRALTDLEPDGLCDRLEARGGNLDEPFARAKTGDLVRAGVGRLHLALGAACDRRQLDECARHDGARAVVHDAGQVPRDRPARGRSLETQDRSTG